jgi:hypothetical protein
MADHLIQFFQKLVIQVHLAVLIMHINQYHHSIIHRLSYHQVFSYLLFFNLLIHFHFCFIYFHQAYYHFFVFLLLILLGPFLISFKFWLIFFREDLNIYF